MQLQEYLSWRLVCSSIATLAGIFIMGIGLLQCSSSGRYIYHGELSVPLQGCRCRNICIMRTGIAAVAGIFIMRVCLF